MFKLKMAAILAVTVSRFFPKYRPWVWSRFATIVYPFISSIDQGGNLTLLNYGYAYHSGESGPVLPDSQEKDRFSIQLYYRVAEGADLSGKRVLEVGSGRGGGTVALKHLCSIDEMVGLELCEQAVHFCNTAYDEEGLSYIAGSAEEIPFGDDSFDAVVNVESSHCYEHIDRFFSEVVRVLRPGGRLLYTDFREPQEWPGVRAQMQRAGLEIIKEDNITGRVVEALEKDNDRKAKLIENVVPRSARSFFSVFAAMEGLPTYKAFKNGDVEYRCFVLQNRQAG